MALGAVLARKFGWSDGDDEKPVVYHFERVRHGAFPRGGHTFIHFDEEEGTGRRINCRTTYTDPQKVPLVVAHLGEHQDGRLGLPVIRQEVYWKRFGAQWQHDAEFDRDDDGDRFYSRNGKVEVEQFRDGQHVDGAQTEEHRDGRE